MTQYLCDNSTWDEIFQQEDLPDLGDTSDSENKDAGYHSDDFLEEMDEND